MYVLAREDQARRAFWNNVIAVISDWMELLPPSVHVHHAMCSIQALNDLASGPALCR